MSADELLRLDRALAQLDGEKPRLAQPAELCYWIGGSLAERVCARGNAAGRM